MNPNVEKAKVCISGIVFKLLSFKKKGKKGTVSLMQHLCVLVGNVTNSSEYLAYSIETSTNTR